MIDSTKKQLVNSLDQGIEGLTLIEHHPEIITEPEKLRQILIHQNHSYLKVLKPNYNENLYSMDHQNSVTIRNMWQVMKKLVNLEDQYKLYALISQTLRAYIYIAASLHGYVRSHLVPIHDIHGDPVIYGRKLGKQKYGLLLKTFKLASSYRFDYLKGTK